VRLLAVTDADPRRAGDAPDRRVALPHARGREPNDLLLVLDTYPDDSADLVEVECVDARGMRETERLTPQVLVLHSAQIGRRSSRRIGTSARPIYARAVRLRSVCGFVALLVGMTVSFSADAAATPAEFTLTFDGTHVADTTFPVGLRHDGRFTASAPFCAAGRAYDVKDVQFDPLTVLRMHTCDDGSGSFTALMTAVAGEHGGGGPWKIVEGTGRYEKLRGFGTYTGETIGGDAGNTFVTVEFRTVWHGVVDFDAEPPTLSAAGGLTKLRRPPGAYVLRVTLRVPAEDLGVRYVVDVRAGRALLDLQKGSTRSGLVKLKFVIRPPRRARAVQFLVSASDAVGNESTTTRAVKVR